MMHHASGLPTEALHKTVMAGAASWLAVLAPPLPSASDVLHSEPFQALLGLFMEGATGPCLFGVAELLESN